MAKKKVLVISIDSKLIDPNLSTTTGWDANRVRAAAQDANKRLVELGYELQSCLDPRGTDEVLSQTHFQGFQGKNLTASWLVLVLGYRRRIPVCLRK